MERAEVLILKLQEQFRKKEPVAQMLLTIQLIQQELMQGMGKNIAGVQKSKVSIVMPFRATADFAITHETLDNEEKIVELLHIDESEIERELEEIKKSAELKNDLGLKGRPSLQSNYDPMEEVPTLSTHSPVMDKKKYSVSHGVDDKETAGLEINDTLKESRTELAEKLQDVPIRDLRKAIGINDRYLYINELLSGDEAMFERSVKTLNQFSILPEAEFWMQRELKLKLGWNEDMILVQQFIQLVRRRFS
jgi:hypothetical protein